ncbi:MAG: hypothetical protein BMS9Abin32_316 [Gammaproteobacteria bacterium]|nr:MAG: hypothetical protein BMS9Abin32_316 [Gammaproteobacteria bacterium]
MVSLTAKFLNTTEKSQDSEKLLNLYWNRAELKKEFARLRKEQYRLKDKIKEQQGATARVQQKLDHLENLLLDPDWAGNVVIYFRLRGVALRCQRKLARFGEQLKQQREQREQNHILTAWNGQRTAEARALEQQILEKRESARMLQEQLQSERRRHQSATGFLRMFRRRSVAAMLEKLGEQIELTQQEEKVLMQGLAEIKNRPPPETKGLDIPTKRSINLMILAFAQQLYLHFSDDDLAQMVKEASEKSVGAINYGNNAVGDDMLEKIQQRIEAMEAQTDFAGVLQKRAKLIGEKTIFANDDEAVPVSASVATVFRFASDGSVKTIPADILGENYWGIAEVLSQ